MGSSPSQPSTARSKTSAQHRGSRSQARQGTSAEPEYGDTSEVIFETFYKNDEAKTYICCFNQGQRYYLDSWDSNDWKSFPAQWYHQGELVRDGGSQAKEASGITSEDIDISGGMNISSNAVSDREGIFEHPTRGTLATYMVEEKRNILYYYCQDNGIWIKFPTTWEMETDFVRSLVPVIQDTFPDWKDQVDIVAALRNSNYDPDDAVASMLSTGVDDPLIQENSGKGSGADRSKMLKEKNRQLAEFEHKLNDTKKQLSLATKDRDAAIATSLVMEKELKQLREVVSSLKVETKTSKQMVESLQDERPKTSTGRRMSMAAIALKREKTIIKEPEPVVVEDIGPVIDDEMLDMITGLHKGLKNLDKQHLSLKDMVGRELNGLSDMMVTLGKSMKKLNTADSAVSKEMTVIRNLYRKEMLQRKILYNQLQEIRGNIRVFCRCRPDKVNCLKFTNDEEISTTNPQGRKVSYQFDKVYPPNTTQAKVFEDTLPIITSASDGYNVCIIAYGQTNSGKTHTMMGPKNDPGVNVRAVNELFKLCNERERIVYTLKVSLIEVYNETLIDLLNADADADKLIIQMKGKNLTVTNMVEIEIKSSKDIDKIIDTGNKNRSTTQTNMNYSSSRSHLLMMIKVTGQDSVSKQMSHGSLTLVDLAGSERVAKTGVEGKALVEAAAINKSLSSLGQVFMALSSNSMHVPYRNSKLTQLLQPSLGGDAKTAMFVNVSPDPDNLSETLSTLQFGNQARQVVLGKPTQMITK